MLRLPIRVQEDAANKPNASAAYQTGTATTGNITIATAKTNGWITDGDTVLLLAEEVDANGNPAGAWELSEPAYDDLATDEYVRGTVIASSNSGAAIDWSTATGIDKTPRLTVIDMPGDKCRQVSSYSAASDQASVSFTNKFRAGRNYLLTFSQVRNDRDDSSSYGHLYMAFSRSGTFDTASGDYQWRTFGYGSSYRNTDAGTGEPLLTSASDPIYAQGHASYSASLDWISGAVFIFDPANSAVRTTWTGTCGNGRGTSAAVFHMGGCHDYAAAVDGVRLRILPGAGSGNNIGHGEFRLIELGGDHALH